MRPRLRACDVDPRDVPSKFWTWECGACGESEAHPPRDIPAWQTCSRPGCPMPASYGRTRAPGVPTQVDRMLADLRPAVDRRNPDPVAVVAAHDLAPRASTGYPAWVHQRVRAAMWHRPAAGRPADARMHAARSQRVEALFALKEHASRERERIARLADPEERRLQGLGLDRLLECDVYELASLTLRGTPAAGEPQSMRKSHDAADALPPSRRQHAGSTRDKTYWIRLPPWPFWSRRPAPGGRLLLVLIALEPRP